MALQYDQNQAVADQTITQDQLAARSNAAINPGVITLDQLKPATPINLPSVPPTTGVADSLMSGVGTGQKSLQDYINSLTPAPTELDSKNQAILDRIATLTGQDAGKSQATAQANIDSGAVDFQKKLTDLNGQVNIGNAEYMKIAADSAAEFANLGGNGAPETKAVLGAQQSGSIRAAEARKASKAAEVGMLAARAQATAGNLTAALTIAKNAVDAKFSPIEDEIKVKQAQLAALAPSLNKQEAIRAKALEMKYKDDQDKIAEEKAKAKENTSIALSAGIQTKFVNKNGEFFDTNSGAPYKTPADFFKAAGVTSFDEAYKKGLVSDWTPSKSADFDFVQKARADYPTAGILSTDAPDVAAAKIKQTAKYRKETYIAPPSSSSTGVNGLSVSPTLAAAITAGTIDPNKINSRTLSIYESIAKAAVDAVGAHAGAAGETKAVTDLVAYKSTATRTLGVLEKNLPLVANLADKVNQTGVPGLDSYLQGVKSYTGNNPDVIKYINSVKTLRSEYAQMLAKGNVATESDKHEAEQAIPAGLSGSAYNALGDQLKLEAQNILQASDDAIRAAKDKSSSNANTSNVIPVGTDGAAYGFPGYMSDGTQWVQK